MTDMLRCSRPCVNDRREMPWKASLRMRIVVASLCAALGSVAAVAQAQSVGLPAPRLLTTVPMGGKAGAQVEIVVSGESLEDADELIFSDPRITATRKLDAAGLPEPNKYLVDIAADCPVGLYEARMMTRLGISSSRAFSVGELPEVVRTKANTSLETAVELPVNSLCNASTSPRAVDHYLFAARKGQRIVVECAAQGIDSKLKAVLILGDAAGRDLAVERRGGVLDFTVPEDGKYVIKIHDLTYKGGSEYFYRLALQELPAEAPITPQAATHTVSSFSWPPEGLPAQAASAETEPNNEGAKAQKITLPCDIAGSFFPAADVDVFEFEAKQGDVWWVEVASERFGLPTDPAIVVQHVSGSGDAEKLTDVVELSDIPSPVKVSSNGYAYDGPPYNAGSPDILGKLEIKQDGIHRLQISDLFGGTRSDPRNIYRLVIRKAAPDFALVAWALHMELRNGDRNALSKPMALRGGASMALEVIAVRRDGFDGEIELAMEGLPEGVTAQGLKIPRGQSRGIMVVSAKARRASCLWLGSFHGPRRDRRRDGNAAGAAGFDGLAGPRRLAGVSQPAAADGRAGIGQRLRSRPDHDFAGQERCLGSYGRRKADDSACADSPQRVLGRHHEIENVWRRLRTRDAVRCPADRRRFRGGAGSGGVENSARGLPD